MMGSLQPMQPQGTGDILRDLGGGFYMAPGVVITGMASETVYYGIIGATGVAGAALLANPKGSKARVVGGCLLAGLSALATGILVVKGQR